MSPLGKFTLALLGLRFFGAEGFFIGLFLGHMLIDRTLVITALEKRLSLLDDNIRLMLPYKIYRYYNRIDGNFWGKIWGMLFGSLLYGVNGFILFFIVGHFVFDTPNSRHARKFRKELDFFFDNNWGKIGGAVLGFVSHSRILLFSGIIAGFFIDYYRMENANLFPFARIRQFWYKVNPLKLWRHSQEARHVAFIQAMAGLAAKVAKADGQVTEEEVRAFKKAFAVKQEENSKVAKVFNKAKTSSEGIEKYTQQLNWLTQDNLPLKENVVDNLFKIAVADSGGAAAEALDLLRRIARQIDLPEGNFEVIQDIYTPKSKNATMQSFYDVLGVFCNASDCEIKRRWKELIVKYHPDRLQARGASAEEIESMTLKMAEINNAYQAIMKSRKII